MKHFMKLKDDQLDKMARGSKTIELRLWDEKRKKLKPFDEISFEGLESKRVLKVSVLELYHYRDFYEAYLDFTCEELGYDRGAIKDPKDMELIYSPQAIKTYGVLAIKIEI